MIQLAYQDVHVSGTCNKTTDITVLILTLSVWSPGGVGAFLHCLLGVPPQGSASFWWGGVRGFVIAGILVTTAVSGLCLAHTSGFSTLFQIHALMCSIWIKELPQIALRTINLVIHVRLTDGTNVIKWKNTIYRIKSIQYTCYTNTSHHTHLPCMNKLHYAILHRWQN